jgi:hypothetical protein
VADGFERHDSWQARVGEICSFHGVQVVGGSNPLAPTNRYKALVHAQIRAGLARQTLAESFAMLGELDQENASSSRHA